MPGEGVGWLPHLSFANFRLASAEIGYVVT